MASLSGDVAQLVERLICIQEVTGSSPVISIRLEMDGLAEQFMVSEVEPRARSGPLLRSLCELRSAST